MNFSKNLFSSIISCVSLLLVPSFLAASDIGSADVEILKGLYPGKAYSPYAKRSFPSKVLFGAPCRVL